MPEWIINLDDDDLLEDLRDQLEEPERVNDYFSPTLDDDPDTIVQGVSEERQGGEAKKDAKWKVQPLRLPQTDLPALKIEIFAK